MVFVHGFFCLNDNIKSIRLATDRCLTNQIYQHNKLIDVVN